MIPFFAVLFLSGATVPREAFPEGVRRFPDLVPLTYVVELLRGPWVGDVLSKHSTDILVLSGMLALGVVASAATFRWE